MRKLTLIAAILLLVPFIFAQQTAPSNAPPPLEAVHTMDAMSGAMAMGPHMHMTAPRPAQPGDDAKAAQVLAAAHLVMTKYQDYHTALAEGYKIFLPQLPQKQYHFTNYMSAMLNESSFDPARPTSLLYDPLPNGGYQLVGVMYTAPKRFTEDQLDQRIPLSVAAWHQHTNFCAAPKGRQAEYLPPNPKFGLIGSISTQEACEAEGGTFKPVLFNWMVHVYPNHPGHEFALEGEHGHSMGEP